MGSDQTVEILRGLLKEGLILSCPLLLAAALVSLLVSLMQTLTSVQEQTLTAVPRLIVVFVLGILIMPWMVHRFVWFTVHLWVDLGRYLG
jgi:flagellar biosynthesis protein FliQ